MWTSKRRCIIPNPVESTSHFYLQTEEATIFKPTYDPLCRVLQREFQFNHKEVNEQSDLSLLSPEIYIFELSDSDSSIYQKVAIN